MNQIVSDFNPLAVLSSSIGLQGLEIQYPVTHECLVILVPAFLIWDWEIYYWAKDSFRSFRDVSGEGMFHSPNLPVIH